MSSVPVVGIVGDMWKAGRTSVNILSKPRTVSQGLELAERFLKPKYTEVAKGVFRSEDGLRQFRMTDSDIIPLHGNIGPHFNFEIFSPFNRSKKLRNFHVPIIDP